METLLEDGSVVPGQDVRPMDVLLESETVAGMAPGLAAGDAGVVDCTGKLLFPGSIDAHTHFYLEESGTITAAGQIQNIGYTPYGGFANVGRILRVYLRGALSLDRGEVLPTQGTFLPRGKCCL